MNLVKPSVALGLWPLAGITTVGVTKQDAYATLAQAIDLGITTFDTAFSYGYEGESDYLLGRFVKSQRDRFRIISKVGQRWTLKRERVVDGSPDQLIADAELNLRRIGVECVDLLMLHSPDPAVPIEVSTSSLCSLYQRGLCQSIGVCNVNAEQLKVFHATANAESTPCVAVQCPLNLMQRQSQEELLPEARDLGIRGHAYWTLMKGLLAGRIQRNHQFAPGDSRPRYEIFQGESRERAHRIVDALSELGREVGSSVAELAIGWTLSQPGIEHALVGARTADQVDQIARARPLDAETLGAVNQIASSE